MYFLARLSFCFFLSLLWMRPLDLLDIVLINGCHYLESDLSSNYLHPL
uniref:Uncharacterized protein n=1 Tax=Utricularia reniformis TaxID=192314 RepID=A0A1Y0B2Z4_9LAMI|nr:hypothetical protein AEK19_MT1584 [Utricularia reniformis]ART31768.1 hypothetical protein AEK19_MT1584 [Utricularia reniformis]